MGLDDLKSQRSSKIRQAEQAESDKRSAERKAQQLRQAYKQLNSAIDEARKLRSAVNNKKSAGDEWKGRKAEKYSDYVSGPFKSNFNTYIDRLDNLQDAVNREMVRQENRAIDLDWDILGLRKSINNLWHQIQNWFN